jgi:long-chain fatty acid transport protein
MKASSLSLAVAVACAVAVPAAQATNGYMSHAYSPTAKGMAGAGEAALPQDSMSLVGNPAGLTRIGQRADVGLTWFSPERKYDGVQFDPNNGAFAPVGSGDGTGGVTSENNDFFVPNFGYSHPIDNVSSVGIAVFGNGGMNTDFRAKDTAQFPGLGPLGTFAGNFPYANPPHDFSTGVPLQIPGTTQLGGGNAGVNLEQLGISLGYARNIVDNFTLGASFLIGYQTFEAKGLGAFQGFTKTFNESAAAGNPRSPANLTNNGEDSAWGYGFQIGALWDVSPMVSLGISYRSKMYMDKFDKYSDLFADGGDFDIPAVGSIGVAFRPNDQWTVALDVQQIWYGDVDAVANTNQLATKCNAQQNPSGFNSSYCLGGKNGAGFGWDDMTVLKIGVQYMIDNQWTVRAGYSHGDQPVSKSEVAFNTLAPAVIQDHWTLGATWRLRDDYELDFWGAYMPEETVKASMTAPFTGGQQPEIKMSQYEIGVNFRWLFN